MFTRPVTKSHIDRTFCTFYNNVAHGYTIHYSAINNFKCNAHLPYTGSSEYRCCRAGGGPYNAIADQDIFKSPGRFCSAFNGGAKTAHNTIGDGDILAGSCTCTFKGNTVV